MFCPAVAVCSNLEVPSHRSHLQHRLNYRAKGGRGPSASRVLSDESSSSNLWPPEELVAEKLQPSQDAVVMWMKSELVPVLERLDERLERLDSLSCKPGLGNPEGSGPAFKESTWRKRAQKQAPAETGAHWATEAGDRCRRSIIPLPPGDVSGFAEACEPVPMSACSRHSLSTVREPVPMSACSRHSSLSSACSTTKPRMMHSGSQSMLHSGSASLSDIPIVRHQKKRSTHESIHTLQMFEKAKERSRSSVQVWDFLDNPDSRDSGPCSQRYHFFLSVFTVLAVCAALLQTIEPSIMPDALSLVQVAIEVLFTLELGLRFIFCPRHLMFFLEWHNVIDLLAVLPLPVRAMLHLKLGGDPDSLEEVKMTVLAIVPVLRLLKLIRRFERFRLLLCAFELYIEALPTCLFSLTMLTLIFSALIFLVEPRDNINSMPAAMWLTVMTMTTVGYGDKTPETALGSIIATCMVITSCLYMAMPLGIIGQAFTEVWDSRDKLLLRGKTKDLLRQWAYKAKNIPVLFEHFDMDGDGTLTQMEFIEMIKQMRIGLSDERALELFNQLDVDGSGLLDGKEFVSGVFPDAYKDVYGVDEIFAEVVSAS